MNSTVNWRRSPELSPASEVRRPEFFSVSLSVRDAPHSPQNLNCGGFSVPQLAQRAFSAAPHSPQNFIFSGLSKPQLAQRTVPLLSREVFPASTLFLRFYCGENSLQRL